MAFTKVHIACGYVGASTGGHGSASLFNRVSWSQTFDASAPGVTTQGAPNAGSSYGQPSFEVRSSVDIYVAVGAAPDPSAGPRIFVPAGETRNIFCDAGDKLGWALAS